ncbi:hypothetical protein [Acinetobacter sp. YH12124]|uniref:hypothetical protein n=1 Tax=Acinetobacter sp. YH12124 TaxID=2601109 RepID=UPI0015D288C1|nr:hypothetical protein [Acinetobacter sp. YH12124]
MDIQKIKELALANGFKLKDQASGIMDLNAHVYDFANAIEREVKSQAVPEGFALVPKEPNKQFKNVLSRYLDELWMGEWGCDWDGFICVNGIDPNEIWQFMIEAQEQSHV